MVNVKSTITGLCLLAATVSAANIHNEKRHTHHRRHNKKPCSAPSSMPYGAGNSTAPIGTGTGLPVSATSSQGVVTVTVVPVPVNPSPSEPISSGTSSPVVASSEPAGPAPSEPAQTAPAPSGSAPPACGVATSYVTVQETVTVTADSIPSSSSVVIPAASSTTLSSSTLSSSSTSTSTSSTSVAAVSKVKAPVVTPIIETPVPIQPSSTSTTTTSPSAAAGGFLQAGGGSSSAPAPAPTQAAQNPAPATSNGGYSGGKMGTSWIPGGPWSGLNIPHIPWVYDWGQVADGVPSGVEYIPTLHDKDKCPGFAAQLASQPDVHFVKHFNEPDMYGYGGSGMSPSEAAAAHKTYISPLAGKYALGLPAITSDNNGMSGTNWLTAFVQETGCDDFAFADMHFYGGSEDVATQAGIFLGYVDNWVKTVDSICAGKNLPIWITEFSAGAVGDVGAAAAFMAIAGPALESNARVARYSYFFPANNILSSGISAIESAFHH